MPKYRVAACIAVLLMFAGTSARAADRVDPGTLTGKMIVGYQGWFNCPNDGAGVGWGHWMAGLAPAVDMLPDMSDFPAADRCPSSMKNADGRPLDLFTNHDVATVNRHFAWMQQYGLDGVALQRFATALLKPQTLKNHDIVLDNVRRAAEDHGRVFFVMYDLSGMKSADLPLVVQDWARLQHEGLTRSSAYQHHRGHPLLAVWGLGFSGRNFSPAQAAALLDGLERESASYGGVTIMGGVPAHWRTRDQDASRDGAWEQVWHRLGVISPWSIGRFNDDAGADNFRRTVLEPDMKAAQALGADYMPVVFPGYSRANGARADHHPADLQTNKIPRRCGRFYWRQVSNALTSGATMLYGAMFDEVNEGTALFKVLPDKRDVPVQGIPADDSFVTLDADGCHLPSDWYLRLSGAAAGAVRNHEKPSAALPLPLPSDR